MLPAVVFCCSRERLCLWYALCCVVRSVAKWTACCSVDLEAMSSTLLCSGILPPFYLTLTMQSSAAKDLASFCWSLGYPSPLRAPFRAFVGWATWHFFSLRPVLFSHLLQPWMAYRSVHVAKSQLLFGFELGLGQAYTVHSWSLCGLSCPVLLGVLFVSIPVQQVWAKRIGGGGGNSNSQIKELAAFTTAEAVRIAYSGGGGGV